MKVNNYIEMLQRRLAPFFNFKNPEEYTLPLQLAGELNATNERYLLVRKFNIYTINNDEYLFVQSFNEPITQITLSTYISWIKTKMQTLKPRQNHMTSSYILVLVSEFPVSEESINYITTFKYHKDYFLTLKGWSDLALIIVDLTNDKIITNKFGKKASVNFKL